MTKHRYHSAAIILHWLIALVILVMLTSGLYMVNAEITKAEQFRLYQWHKAGGVIVLCLVLLRVLVRLTIKPPALPEDISVKHQSLAHLGHIGLYGVMIMIPLSGWLMVSASPFGLPTYVFVDWLKWPHIPFVERDKAVESIAKWLHLVFAYSMILLLFGHIGALIWHKTKHKINLLHRMWWSKTQ